MKPKQKMADNRTRFIIVNPECISLVLAPPSRHGGFVLYRSVPDKLNLATEVTRIERYSRSTEDALAKTTKRWYTYEVQFVNDPNGGLRAIGRVDGLFNIPRALRAVLEETASSLARFAMEIHSFTFQQMYAYIRIRGLKRSGSILRPADLPAGCDSECVICSDKLAVAAPNGNTELLLLDCHHLFHLECISRWIKNGKGPCPSCRNIMRPIHTLAAVWSRKFM